MRGVYRVSNRDLDLFEKLLRFHSREGGHLERVCSCEGDVLNGVYRVIGKGACFFYREVSDRGILTISAEDPSRIVEMLRQEGITLEKTKNL